MGESGRRLIALEAEAMFTLGMHYELGMTGVEDDIEALAWHTLAAADGHAEALRHTLMLDRILGPDRRALARARVRQLRDDVSNWRALS